MLKGFSGGKPDMKFHRSVCALKCLRSWPSLCVLLVLVLVFLMIWWSEGPAEKAGALDMATDSIDDMFHGCRAKVASIIDLFGVLEWQYNKKFSIAWASAEKKAKKPLHWGLKEDHTTVVYIYTKMERIRRAFNEAVKTGKDKYNTAAFQFHYFYFYLTETIQILRRRQTVCRTTYHRKREHFNQTKINTHMRFGGFIWVSSRKESVKLNGSGSCFEIYTCFGADITYYSYKSQKGQVIIPPYEVFEITHVLKNDPWCSVVYKLQSTRIPRRDLNCKLNENLLNTDFNANSKVDLYGSNVLMLSACVIVLIIISVVLVKHEQMRFVATVLGTLLVLITVGIMW